MNRRAQALIASAFIVSTIGAIALSPVATGHAGAPPAKFQDRPGAQVVRAMPDVGEARRATTQADRLPRTLAALDAAAPTTPPSITVERRVAPGVSELVRLPSPTTR